MLAFLSWHEVAAVVGALAAAVAVVVALLRLWMWLRNYPRNPLRRRRPSPITVDQAVKAQRKAGDDFYEKLMEISSSVEQFEPWERPGFEADLKQIRELKRSLDSIGKGPVSQAFVEGSAVVRVERVSRYAVIRTIDMLDGYRAAPAPPDDQRHQVRWAVVEEPRLRLEHAADLFRMHAWAAQETPLEPNNEILDVGSWDELKDYAAPALERYSGPNNGGR
jgi:hypothetical protein